MAAATEKTVIIVAGPTAVGKTALAIQLAQHFDTEILSADSRQCYQELSIGVAKPSLREQAGIPHHFIDSHRVTDKVNVAVFESYAMSIAEDVWKRHDTLIVCGGTGLYLQAFLHGIDPIPPVPPAIRLEVERLWKEGGQTALAAALREEDPLYAADGEMSNPHRMLRALSVLRATGHSIRHFQHNTPADRPFRRCWIGLELPREALYARIDARVDAMMQQGLLEEVQSMWHHRHLNALQTVGYKELFQHLEGSSTREEAIAHIKKHTRHYAKRQLTWFHSISEIQWFEPGSEDEIFSYLKASLGPLRT